MPNIERFLLWVDLTTRSGSLRPETIWYLHTKHLDIKNRNFLFGRESVLAVHLINCTQLTEKTWREPGNISSIQLFLSSTKLIGITKEVCLWHIKRNLSAKTKLHGDCWYELCMHHCGIGIPWNRFNCRLESKSEIYVEKARHWNTNPPPPNLILRF